MCGATEWRSLRPLGKVGAQEPDAMITGHRMLVSPGLRSSLVYNVMLVLIPPSVVRVR